MNAEKMLLVAVLVFAKCTTVGSVEQVNSPVMRQSQQADVFNVLYCSTNLTRLTVMNDVTTATVVVAPRNR